MTQDQFFNLYESRGPGYLYQTRLTGPLPDYSVEYSRRRYDTYDTNRVMSELRYDLVRSHVDSFESICDYGYGNGSFLRYCVEKNLSAWGYDISDYPLPDSCQRAKSVDQVQADVFTFFDSLEHLVDRDLVPLLTSLRTRYVCISVPWYHEELGAEWFMSWKHRRENEHIHHWDSHGLVNLLVQSQFKILYLGNDEDRIRRSPGPWSNILTVIAQRI